MASALAATLLALVVAGCVDVDGELAANGRLTFRYTYDPPRHATYKSERTRLGSAHVRVENLERDQSLPGYPPNEFVTATLAVDDPRQLSSAAAFAAVTVDVDLNAGRLRVAFPGLAPDARQRVAASTAGDTDRRALRLSLVLPGAVTKAEPTASIDGHRVTWIFSYRELAALGDTVTLAADWTPGSAPAS